MRLYYFSAVALVLLRVASAQSLSAHRTPTTSSTATLSRGQSPSPQPVAGGGVVTLLAGGGRARVAGSAAGKGTAATLFAPAALALAAPALGEPPIVYFVDSGNGTVRSYDPATGAVSLLGGGGASSLSRGCANGWGTNSLFTMFPGAAGLAASPPTFAGGGPTLFVADCTCAVVRVATLTDSSLWVALLAGNGTAGVGDGAGSAAKFNQPLGVALRASTSVLYLADRNNNRVRAITTPGGVVTTLAGGGGAAGTLAGVVDGVGTAALFNWPRGLALDDAGGVLYVAEESSNRLRRIIIATATVSVLAGGGSAGGTTAGSADGVGSAALFSLPSSLALDAAAGLLWVTDSQNRLLRAVVTASGAVATLGLRAAPLALADGLGAAASFSSSLSGVAPDGAGGLFVGDAGNNVLRRVANASALAAALVTTAAGGGAMTPGEAGFADGTASRALFARPQALSVAGSGALLLVADTGNNRLRAVNTSSGAVATLAGSGAAGAADGLGASASFSAPAGVAADVRGNAFVADTGNCRLRFVTAAGAVTTAAGAAACGSGIDGVGTAARFGALTGLGLAARAGWLAIADTSNHAVRLARVGVTADDDDGVAALAVSTLAGGGAAALANGVGTNARFSSPMGVALDADAASAFVADTGNNCIRLVIVATQTVTTLAGIAVPGFIDGAAALARFAGPRAVVYNVAAAALLIADGGNNRVRLLPLLAATLNVSTLAGGGIIPGANGVGTAAGLVAPNGLALAPPAAGAPALLYIAETNASRLRAVALAAPTPAASQRATRSATPTRSASTGASPAAVTLFPATAPPLVTTLAMGGRLVTAGYANGVGTNALFNAPEGVAVGPGVAYIAELSTHAIRAVNLSSGAVTTIAGGPPWGSGTGRLNGVGTCECAGEKTGAQKGR